MQGITRSGKTSRARCLCAIIALLAGSFLSGSLPGQAQGAQSVTVEDVSTPSDAEVALKDMRDVVRHLRRTALDLIDEVEQRDMVVVGAPLLIQPVPEKKDPHPGTMEEMFVLGDAQPPRKKWVDITMARFDKLMPLLSQEQARIVVPEARKAGAEASLGELAALVADMQQHYESLKKLTVGPLYSNVEIGKEALAIYNDTSKLEKPWKELVFIIRKKS